MAGDYIQMSMLELMLEPTLPVVSEQTFPAEFLPNQVKALKYGFSLIRYNREEKSVDYAEPDGSNTRWVDLCGSPYDTFAQAERMLKAMLSEPRVIDSSLNGFLGGYQKLSAAGFVNYRREALRIKHNDKSCQGWSTWKKFTSQEECQAAWDELMKNDKALHG